MNSGFLCETDGIAEIASTFSDVEVISQGSSFFIAQATRYGRRWILKGICREAANDELLRQQLLKEFEILSALSHPGIVKFYGIEDVGTLGHCIIMEWIEGPTLEEALRQQSLSRDDRRRLLFEIVEAVAYIHSKGIVHRDLKPSNIMVRQNGGSAVVIDFGLADADAFTVLKYPAGTPGYVSERQREANTPDTSDDVYSLGVIMSSLYPEYGAIVRRCKSAGGRRYANGAKLLQALRRRCGLWRRIFYASLAAVALCAIAILGYHNHALRTSVDGLDTQVSQLREGNRQQNLASDQMRERMTDSLATLKRELARESSFRNEIERHDAHMDDLKRLLKQKCREIYAQYLKDRKSLGFAEEYSGQRLIEKLMSFKNSFIANQSGLADDDRQDLETAFSIYYGDIITEYYNKVKYE